MSVHSRLEAAQTLYEHERLEGTLLSLLVAIAATSRKRYPRGQYNDGEAFTRFVEDEIAIITGTISNVKVTETLEVGYRGEAITLPGLLYRIMRNQLVHEATMPDDVRFMSGGTTLLQVGSSVTFNVVFLQGLANAVLLAPENKGIATPPELQEEMNPSTVLACLLEGPLDFCRPLRYEPAGADSASERRGYSPENPTPLEAEDLTPPKGDTAVQPPRKDQAAG